MTEMAKNTALKEKSLLVVDDSIIYRSLLSEIVRSVSPSTQVATCPSGTLALQKMEREAFDIVLLDIEMPGMDGLETLRCIREKFPRVKVVMVSGTSQSGTQTTMKALGLGALEFIRKPEVRSPQEGREQLLRELKPILQLAGISCAGEALQTKAQATAQASRPVSNKTIPVIGSYKILAIGVSTGGPPALSKLIPALPANFPIPIVIVQHMPPSFTEALARDLDRKSKLEVREAKEGDQLVARNVYIAPGGKHMVVRRQDDKVLVGLNEGPPENSCRPAVDVLFRSVAAAYSDANVLALVMTGMGADGMKGVQALKRKRCFCLTQSQESCVVYGMPQAVDSAGLSDESVDLDQLAGRLTILSGLGGKNT